MKMYLAMLFACSMFAFAMDDQDDQDFWEDLDSKITEKSVELIHLLDQSEEHGATQGVIGATILEKEDDYPQEVVSFLRKLAEGPVTNLHGVVAKNNSGSLECKVTWNSYNKKYSGTLENKKYSPDTWQTRQLSDQKAEQYYVQLLAYLKQ